MKIEMVEVAGRHKQGTLKDLSVEEIEYVLGSPNIKDDPLKVSHSWGFMVTADSGATYACGIWSYKGSEKYNEWSYYGPRFVFDALFGKQHIIPNNPKTGLKT
jgi:hypothetical protein